MDGSGQRAVGSLHQHRPRVHHDGPGNHRDVDPFAVVREDFEPGFVLDEDGEPGVEVPVRVEAADKAAFYFLAALGGDRGVGWVKVQVPVGGAGEQADR